MRSLRCLRGFPLAASREQQVTPTDGSEGGITANAALSCFVFFVFFSSMLVVGLQRWNILVIDYFIE